MMSMVAYSAPHHIQFEFVHNNDAVDTAEAHQNDETTQTWELKEYKLVGRERFDLSFASR